jgi:hypothetical protein
MFPRFLCFVLVCVLAFPAFANAGESPVQKQVVQAPVTSVKTSGNSGSNLQFLGFLKRLRPKNWKVFEGSREFHFLPRNRSGC